jgi:hypothetical protein
MHVIPAGPLCEVQLTVSARQHLLYQKAFNPINSLHNIEYVCPLDSIRTVNGVINIIDCHDVCGIMTLLHVMSSSDML